MGKDRSALRTSFYTEISGPFVCITIGIVETAHSYDRIMTSTRNPLPSLLERPGEPQPKCRVWLLRPAQSGSSTRSASPHCVHQSLGRNGRDPFACLSVSVQVSLPCPGLSTSGSVWCSLLRTVSAVLSLSPATGPAAAATKP